LQKRGIQVGPGNLRIADRAPLTLFYHIALDEVTGKKIGTTGRGIGQTYGDRVTRVGLNVYDLFDEKGLERKVVERVEETNKFLKGSGVEINGSRFSEEIEELFSAREKLLPYIYKDIGRLVKKNDGNLLFEGAQGTFLDVDLGTIPYVTSSNTVRDAASISVGCHVYFDSVIGVLKAYTTRVGNGPFPTEQDNDYGEWLRERGGEFGTTTGRPRRCGWLDLVMGEYAVRVNGISEISLSKLDVLDGRETIPVCIGYELDGERIDYFPVTEELGRVVPIYNNLEGWRENTTNARTPRDLPTNARKYIDFIQGNLQVPIKRVGVGKRRDQTIEF